MVGNTRILFLSSTHSARGPMAEYLLNAQQQDSLTAHSAGIAATSVHELAAAVMSEQGIDLADCTSRAIADLDAISFDIVITVSESARKTCTSRTLLGFEERRRLFGGVPVFLHWPVPDPGSVDGDEPQMIEPYRAARDEIQQHIQTLLDDSYLAAITLERKRLHEFVEYFDEGIIVHDENRIFFMVNDAFLRLIGRTREDVIGHDCHDIFPGVGLCGGSCQFKDNSPGLARPIEYPIQFATPEGTARDLMMRTLPMEIEPGRRGIMAVVHDDTRMVQLTSQLEPRRSFHGMVGSTPAVQEIFRTIESVAASNYPVLVTGESGTGKELVASAIHAESGRAKGPFVPVNCGALPEGILESELFGHVRGAFTGAIRDKKGRFELAHRGTLFLDEVGELTPAVQVKLLRVLQQQSFERVGGEKTIKADVRVISATNRDLKHMMREGSFREDLYYRLCVIPITLPPLRERRDDIPYLVDHFLERIRHETGKNIDSLDSLAMDLIRSYRWPGNIRELINALQLAAVRSSGKMIKGSHLPPEVQNQASSAQENGDLTTASPLITPVNPAFTAPEIARRTRLTPETVEQALAATGGNKLKAAKLLGVGRATLYRFFKNQG